MSMWHDLVADRAVGMGVVALDVPFAGTRDRNLTLSVSLPPRREKLACLPSRRGR